MGRGLYRVYLAEWQYCDTVMLRNKEYTQNDMEAPLLPTLTGRMVPNTVDILKNSGVLSWKLNKLNIFNKPPYDQVDEEKGEVCLDIY